MGSCLLLALFSASPDPMRLATSRGPVHVLLHPHPVLTVVYVHGLWTHVDDAWVQHGLRAQLEGSGLDATFIVPEAPAAPGEAVAWPELEALLDEVERGTGVKLPHDVIAAGHSGAYRTLRPWTASSRVKAFVLLDAFYGAPSAWTAWLDGGDDRHVFVLSRVTSPSVGFCRRERVRCARSHRSHMQLVTDGRELPRLLQQAHSSVAEGENDV
jgi:hypothetical protein